VKILLGYIKTEGIREDIFKPTTGNKSLHEISSNNNKVKIVNSAISKKKFTLKSTMFLHNNIHKFIASYGMTHKVKIFW
jgi:hypothetical protein